MSASLTAGIGYRATSAADATVTIRGEITAQMKDRVLAALKAAGPKTRVVVTIDSVGGDIAMATRIGRALRSRRGPVVGVVAGHCSSAALLVLASCKHRIAGADSRYLLHEAELLDPLQGRITASNLRDEARSMEAADRGIARLLAAWTNGNEQTFRDLIDGDTEIGARRAVEIGLLTAVIDRPTWARKTAAAPAAAAVVVARRTDAVKTAAAEAWGRRMHERAARIMGVPR